MEPDKLKKMNFEEILYEALKLTDSDGHHVMAIFLIAYARRIKSFDFIMGIKHNTNVDVRSHTELLKISNAIASNKELFTIMYNAKKYITDIAETMK